MKPTILLLGAAAFALLLADPTTAARKRMGTAWPPETVSGTIMMVEPAANLVVVKGPSGVPFDMKVTSSTRIRSGDQTLNLESLSSDTNQSVSVNYVPERSGDVARSIRIGGAGH